MTSDSKSLAGAGLISLGIYLNIPFSILGLIFDYPQILRQPAGDILTMFDKGGLTLIAVWYAFALAAMLMIVVVVLVHNVLRDTNENLLRIATVFGVLAGVLQVLGLIRWVFVVPSLASAYTDPAATEASRSTAVVVFNALHQYAGVAIGEHLGQIFTAAWAALVSASMIRKLRMLGVAGIVIATVMALGLVEGVATVVSFDPGIFGVLTPFAFIALSIWMIGLGIWMLRQPTIKVPNPETLWASYPSNA